MSPDLADFLTRLFAERRTSELMPGLADRSTRHFYNYLHSVGVEQCNIALARITKAGEAELDQYVSTLLPADFIEEYSAEMAHDDYVIHRSKELSPNNQVAMVDFGLSHRDRMEAYHSGSAKVMQESARYGMAEGYALLGQVSNGGEDGAHRRYGFVFGGPSNSRSLLESQKQELQIAAHALLDIVMPHLKARTEGFSYNLTVRERDILGALASGHQRQKMAHQFNISVPTADMHLASLRRKLGAQTAAEAVAKAYRYGLL